MALHVAVILRLIPDQSEELEIDATGTDIDREWIGFKLNEFDDHALEEAVLLKERAGARVTAIALAGEGVDRMLQNAVARGVDAAVKVEHSLGKTNDARAAAFALKSVMESLGADLVLTGVQTPEDVLGQLSPCLAAALDWPTVNAVNGVTAGDGAVQVKQEYSGGRSATLEITLPAVIGVQSASQPPRYVSGTKLRQAMATPIGTAAADAEGPGVSQAIAALNVPTRGEGAKMFSGNADAVASQIADLLAGRGLIGA